MGTVMWNQMCAPFEEGQWYPYSAANVTCTFSNGIATTILINDVRGDKTTLRCTSAADQTATLDDKLYLSYEINPETAGDYSAEFAYGVIPSPVSCPANTWTRLHFLANSKHTGYILCYLLNFRGSATGATGRICHARNPVYVNLTKMYGAGNEPTMEEFERQCKLNGIDLTHYQPRDTGTLRDWITSADPIIQTAMSGNTRDSEDIAHFVTDCEMPLHSCIVDLPPSLEGYDHVELDYRGRNLLINIAPSYYSQVTLNSDGSMTINGTLDANAWFNWNTSVDYATTKTTQYVQTRLIPNGRYYLGPGYYVDSTNQSTNYPRYSLNMSNYDGTNEQTGTHCTIDSEYCMTVNNDYKYNWMRIYQSEANTYNNYIFYPKLFLASESDRSWEPCNWRKFNVTFDSTIYGGYVDLIKGELVATTGVNNNELYTLTEPIHYSITPQTITSLFGVNNVWCNQGKVRLQYLSSQKTQDSALDLENKYRIFSNMPHLETASGNIVAYNMGAAAKMRNCKVTFSATQSGSETASPDNIRPIVGVDSIPLTLSNTKTTTVTTYNLDETRYGGTIDLVTGQLTITHIYKEITSSMFTAMYKRSSSISDRACTSKASMAGVSTGENNPQGVIMATNMDCKANGAAGSIKAVDRPFATMSSTAGNTSMFICFPDSYNLTSLDLIKEWVDNNPFGVYCLLSTPQTYSITPNTIITSTGINYILSDVGPVEATYYTYYKNPEGTYGGIPIYADNAYFENQNGTASDIVSNNNWFIAGPFDSGTTTSKSYTFYMSANDGITTGLRTFDDLTASSVDYWYNSTKSEGTRTISTAGRYLLLPVRKDQVNRFYLKMGDTYLAKGRAVI